MQVVIPILSIICVILTFIIGFLTFNRNRDKDVRSDASENAVIRTKLDSIGQGVDSIRIDIRANEKRVTELSEHVIRIDESNKALHKRIDRLEGRVIENG